MTTTGAGWNCPYCGYYVGSGATHYCPGPGYYEYRYNGPQIDKPWTWKIEQENDDEHTLASVQDRLKRVEEKLDKLLEYIERPSVVLVAPTEGE